MWTAAGAVRRRGTTLVEMTIAATILTGVLALAFPAMSTITNAGSEGRARVIAQADNRQALIRISREVMNGSLTALDELGAPRFQILSGPARVSITGDLGKTSVTHIDAGTSTDGGVGTSTNYFKTTTGAVGGSGTRGGTAIGRARSTASASDVYDSGPARPRELYFTNNSRMRFQKVLSYSWSPEGEPLITWGPWIEYTVQGRNLVRIENGKTQVVSSDCSGFSVQQTTANTVLITIVTEHRTGDGRTVASQANHAEVVPKN